MAHHKRINGVMHHHDGVYEEGGKAGPGNMPKEHARTLKHSMMDHIATRTKGRESAAEEESEGDQIVPDPLSGESATEERQERAAKSARGGKRGYAP